MNMPNGSNAYILQWLTFSRQFMGKTCRSNILIRLNHKMLQLYQFCTVVILLMSKCYSSPAQANDELGLPTSVECKEEIPDSVTSYQLRNPAEPFIGRINELNYLKTSQSKDKITVITGPKGIGKTELALKYAFELKNGPKYTNVLFIDAETHESLIISFKNIALLNGISINDKTASSIVREIFLYFHNTATLFVFDNANNDNHVINNLQNFTPKQTNELIFLVTSRNVDWNKNKFNILELNHFTKDETKEFITKKLQNVDKLVLNSTDVEKLGELLKKLPLALSKATSFIVYQNQKDLYTIKDFICQFEKIDAKRSPGTSEAMQPAVIDEEIENMLLHSIQSTTENLSVKPIYIYTQRTRPVKQENILDKVERETSRIGQQVSREASRVGQTISEQARNVEKKVRVFFVKLHRDIGNLL